MLVLLVPNQVYSKEVSGDMYLYDEAVQAAVNAEIAKHKPPEKYVCS